LVLPFWYRLTRVVPDKGRACVLFTCLLIMAVKPRLAFCLLCYCLQLLMRKWLNVGMSYVFAC